MFQLYIDGNSLDSNKQMEGGKMESIEFSTKDMYGILDISSQKDPFKLIVNSLCPSIYGHELVKGMPLDIYV